eukprot:693784-Prorocentrum_minimum.AAC.2
MLRVLSMKKCNPPEYGHRWSAGRPTQSGRGPQGTLRLQSTSSTSSMLSTLNMLSTSSLCPLRHMLAHLGLGDGGDAVQLVVEERAAAHRLARLESGEVRGGGGVELQETVRVGRHHGLCLLDHLHLPACDDVEVVRLAPLPHQYLRKKEW